MPIRAPYSPGHSDWFRDGHMSQPDQSGFLPWFIYRMREEKSSFSLVSWEAVSPRLCVAIISSMWRASVLKEVKKRQVELRDGEKAQPWPPPLNTDFISQDWLEALQRTHPWNDAWLVKAIPNQLHLSSTWSELDCCPLQLKETRQKTWLHAM